ncbi:MAG: hypothetical protein LBJ18_01535 [Rickettsiales bacterium]|jgi:hypothetical protein|nr:hypothetical protein [Rickettsiales bacterium]
MPQESGIFENKKKVVKTGNRAKLWLLGGVAFFAFVFTHNNIWGATTVCNINSRCQGIGACGGNCNTYCVVDPSCDDVSNCVISDCTFGQVYNNITCQCEDSGIVSLCSENQYISTANLECTDCPAMSSTSLTTCAPISNSGLGIQSCFVSAECIASDSGGSFTFTNDCYNTDSEQETATEEL